jgi:hypothetical protein
MACRRDAGARSGRVAAGVGGAGRIGGATVIKGSSLLAAFTFVGALVGYLTGIFTLWDRYAKGRPIACLASGPDNVLLRISNPGDYSIFILSAKITPKVFFLSRGPDIRTIIEDQLSGITYWPIEPKGIAEFVIADLFEGGRKLSLTDQRVSFSVGWRRGSTTWLPQMPVAVRTDTSTVNKIRDAIIERMA